MSIPVSPVSAVPVAIPTTRRGDNSQAGSTQRGAAQTDARPDVGQSTRPEPTRQSGTTGGVNEAQTARGAASPTATADAKNNNSGSGARAPRSPLTDAERAQLQKLRARDREVRAHEAAHAAAGGSYAGAPSFSYQRGPDGVQYAVGGSVSIDTAPVPGDPQATIDKMRQVRAAALAPAQPSSTDRQIAARASQEITQAQAELAAQAASAAEGGGGGGLPGLPGLPPAASGARSSSADTRGELMTRPPRDARVDRALAIYEEIAGLRD